MRPPGSPRELLEWYLEAGVDEVIGDKPVDRFRASAAERGDRAPPRAAAGARRPAGPGDQPGLGFEERAPVLGVEDAAVQSAWDLALTANSVAELRQALERFDGCALKKTATNLCFTDGNPEARIVFVGEGPGAEEDRQGLPFVGPSGRLLDRILDSIGLDRTKVLITNTVFWRPPGNRTPTAQEMATCMPFVERLMELVDPEVLVALGGPAAKAMLASTESVGRLRGRWFAYATPRLARPIQATVTYHPAYLLRTPAHKREVWRDFLGIKRKLEELHIL